MTGLVLGPRRDSRPDGAVRRAASSAEARGLHGAAAAWALALRARQHRRDRALFRAARVVVSPTTLAIVARVGCLGLVFRSRFLLRRHERSSSRSRAKCDGGRRAFGEETPVRGETVRRRSRGPSAAPGTLPLARMGNPLEVEPRLAGSNRDIGRAPGVASPARTTPRLQSGAHPRASPTGRLASYQSGELRVRRATSRR